MKNLNFNLSVIWAFALLLVSARAFSAVQAPLNLMAPVGTETDSTITFLWDKPEVYDNIKGYDIIINGKLADFSTRTNYTAKKLIPNTSYTFVVKAKDAAGNQSQESNSLTKSTKPKSQLFNILDYGAKGDGTTMNTQSIQKAIDACTTGGTVYIPSGTFLSGALFLKSNMTLYIAKGGELKGSTDIKDYYPLILTRFEGWEVKSFASLLTAGKLDNTGTISVTNLTIRGEGKIFGGGSKLGQAMNTAEGKRSRGRLICLMNCQNVYIQGITTENAPCWNIHYTYSTNVTCQDLMIFNNTSNGDGIDPDSSIDSYIFNCTFDTGDDCIAIKSGKNPEGNVINKPTINVRITDCKFIKGHSLAIGSELSGGVKKVLIRDCELGHLDNGLRIKTNKFRGGYVEDVVVKDCNLLKILVTTIYNPNNDGEAAKELSVVKGLEFSNLDMRQGPVVKPIIAVDGFEDPEHYFKNIVFKNIQLPENATVSIKYCDNVLFDNVLKTSGQKPVYNILSSTNVKN